MSRLRYIGDSPKARDNREFAKSFIEQLRFVCNATEEDLNKVASEINSKS